MFRSFQVNINTHRLQRAHFNAAVFIFLASFLFMCIVLKTVPVKFKTFIRTVVQNLQLNPEVFSGFKIEKCKSGISLGFLLVLPSGLLLKPSSKDISFKYKTPSVTSSAWCV